MSFKPMLAATPTKEDGDPTFPKLVSAKLDGIRAIVIGGVVMSRKLKPIPSPDVQELFGRPEFEGLDGELILGNPVAAGCFNTTQSFVMRGQRQSGRERLTFFVFDKVLPGVPFAARLQQAGAAVRASGNKQVVALHHERVNNREEMDSIESEMVNQGHEGIMLRDPSGPYKFGRSTLREGYLIKVKRFADSDAEVLEVLEKMHNDNVAMINELGKTKRSSAKAGMRPAGTMGALRVRDIHTGIEFQVGTGFDDTQRQQWWDNRADCVGLVVKYRSFLIGAKEKPRFPVFVGVRNPLDMD